MKHCPTCLFGYCIGIVYALFIMVGYLAGKPAREGLIIATALCLLGAIAVLGYWYL